MIISLFWIVLMRFAAGFMVWLSILAILALQGVGKLIIISDVFYNLAVVIDKFLVKLRGLVLLHTLH
jgi:hypothetical protein